MSVGGPGLCDNVARMEWRLKLIGRWSPNSSRVPNPWSFWLLSLLIFVDEEEEEDEVVAVVVVVVVVGTASGAGDGSSDGEGDGVSTRPSSAMGKDRDEAFWVGGVFVDMIFNFMGDKIKKANLFR